MECKPILVNAPNVSPAAGHYSHAMRAANLLFVSGQLGARADGSHTADAPFEVQARQAIENMLSIVQAAGAAIDDIAKVTIYVVDVENWPRLNAVYAEMMGDAKPARVVVPVPALHHGYLVEVEAIAVLAADCLATTTRGLDR